MKKIIALALTAPLALGLSLTYANHSHSAKIQKIDHFTQKLSYTIGYNIGHNFKNQGFKISPKSLEAGLHAGLNNEHALLSKKTMEKVIAQYRRESIQKMMAKENKIAQKNLKASNQYIQKISKQSHIHKIQNGLYYKIIKSGSGEKPSLTDTVTVNYKGMLINGKVFDSSYARKKPATFKVDQVIKGWKIALQHMSVGSIWMLYISPKLAYGKFAPPTIGANQALIFKVNLISINHPSHKK